MADREEARTKELVQIKSGLVHPAIMWSFGFMWKIRKEPTMPPDLPRRPDDMQKLVDDLWGLLEVRQKETPAETIDCYCDRQVPGFSDLNTCPFCAVSYEAAPDQEGEEEGEGEEEEGDEEEEDEAVVDAVVDATPEPVALVPMTSSQLANDVVKSDREKRLEDVENDLARWTSTAFRSGWERGRLLTIVRKEKLFTIRGCKNFQAYLHQQVFSPQLAYKYIALHDACPEDVIEWCEGLTFDTMFAMARQAKIQVEGLTKGAEYLHGLFREMVGEVQAQAQITGKAPTQLEAPQVAKDAAESAAKKPGATAAKVKADLRQGTTTDGPRREGRPSGTATKPKTTQPTAAKAVKLVLTLPDPGYGGYINAKSGKVVARPNGNLVGKCIELRTVDDKVLRITLGKQTITWAVTKAP